jgi:hypothetical protein
MSEDLTKKTAETDSDRLKLILTLVQRIDSQGKVLENHGKILTEIRDGLGKLTARFGVVETLLEAVERRLDVLETRLNIIVSRLDGVEARLDSFEKTITRSAHYLGRGQTVLNDAILKIHIGFLDIEERLQGLEPRLNPTNSQT